MNREQWLQQGAQLLERDVLLPKLGKGMHGKLRVSVGFPKGSRGKGAQAIGQCWSREASATKHAEVFISPELNEPSRVLDVLLHEIIHDVVGLECGHRGAFKQAASLCGLEGKMTATVAGDELRECLNSIAKELGPYPHSPLTPGAGGGKKQTTRLLKVVCESCGCVVRMTKKWLDIGAPHCACGAGEMVHNDD